MEKINLNRSKIGYFDPFLEKKVSKNPFWGCTSSSLPQSWKRNKNGKNCKYSTPTLNMDPHHCLISQHIFALVLILRLVTKSLSLYSECCCTFHIFA